MARFGTELKDLQEQGICGERLQEGGRCSARVLEYVSLDPDMPHRGRIGACGTHLGQVSARIESRLHLDRYRSMEQYVIDEAKQQVSWLKELGVDCEVYDDYGHRKGSIIVRNAGQFLAKLRELGFEPPPIYGPPNPNVENNGSSPAQNGQ